ncbi:MAG: sterol desaturase family protein [Gemmatimonadaceae bacterium]|nr:sterol desaturase family protein [Gemmatimonadaceae bacterium]
MLLTLFSFFVFFGLGFLAHLAEVRWPLRSYDTPKSWMIDTLGFGVATAATIASRIAFPHIFDRLPTLPGLHWMTTASHFVSAEIPWPVAFVVSVILLDFLLYVGHRLLHTSALWHTHAAHHSVEHMYWFAGSRASPVHIMVQLAMGTLLGLVWPVAGGMHAIVASTIFYAVIQHFNHANIRWRLGTLEWLFVMPRYHFVHHGAARRLNDSNFGFVLTIWDRMFGTYTDPDDVPENFPLGLEYDVGLGRMFIGVAPRAPLPDAVSAD